MPASKKEKLKAPKLKVLGIIAGGGQLPEKLIASCAKANIKTFIVGLYGQTNPKILEGREHFWSRLGKSGATIKYLKKCNVKDIVFIGSIKRPSLLEILPDLRTAKFFAKIGVKSMGDNGLLSAIREELEKDGFKLHGVHKFMPELLAKEGPIGKYTPNKKDWADIKLGIEISQGIGALDIGQSVIVQEGVVLGVEAVEGTDELILRAGKLKRKGQRGILVKSCKPQQDQDFDLPTIGPDTIKNVAKAGFSGIAIHAGHSLLVEQGELIKLANKHKIFVIGLDMFNFIAPKGSV